MGPWGTEVMARLMLDANLGTGEAGANDNDRNSDVIKCEVLR